MLIADADVALGIKTGGSIIGFVTTYAWGYTGEFGATPGALSGSAREQWDMVPGHPKWDESAGNGARGQMAGTTSGKSHVQLAVKINGPTPSSGLSALEVESAISGQVQMAT